MRVGTSLQRRLFVVICATLAFFGFSGPTSVSADEAFESAGAANHAAIVVEKESGDITTACVSFTSSQITGLQALQLASAQLQPVINASPNYGAAVCALCGQGCSAGDCLTCSNNYWSYWRAPSSTTSFSYSGQGVSTSSVRNGDVEGWVWGQGRTAPPSASFADICAATIRAEVDATSTTLPTAEPVTSTSVVDPGLRQGVNTGGSGANGGGSGVNEGGSGVVTTQASAPGVTTAEAAATSSTVLGDVSTAPLLPSSTTSSAVGIMIGDNNARSVDAASVGEASWGSIVFPLLGLVSINLAVVWMRIRLRRKRTW